MAAAFFICTALAVPALGIAIVGRVACYGVERLASRLVAHRAQKRAGSVSRRASEGHKSAAGDVASVHGASGDAGATSDATIDTGSPGDAAAVLTEAERDWRITLWQPAERRIHA